MKNKKSTNATVTHLLGYLTPKQWADAMKDDTLDQELIQELIEKQEDTYNFDLQKDVEKHR